MVRLLVAGWAGGVDAAMCTLPFRHSMKVWYESKVEAAIIKLLPSPMHGITVSQPFLEIASAITLVPGHNLLTFTA